jgi:FkbM family methyltransferase
MTPFTESLRYDYPSLTKDSIVVDAGAYQGNWAREIHVKYGSIVLAFEPVKRFFDEASANCAPYPRITLFNCGLGGHFRYEDFGVQNDSSGMFAGSTIRERAPVMPLVPHLRQVHNGQYALLKMNVEGAEYEALEHVLAEDAAGMFDNLQVQFHTCAPDWEKRYAAIADGLSRTHELTWRTPFVWENWSKRKS